MQDLEKISILRLTCVATSVCQQRPFAVSGTAPTSPTATLPRRALMPFFLCGLLLCLGMGMSPGVLLAGESWQAILDNAHYQKDYALSKATLESSRAGNEQNPEWLWRKARVIFVEAEGFKKGDARRNAGLDRSMELLKTALKLNPNSAGAHAWYGYTLGLKIESADPETQIKKAYEVKEHLDAAMKLEPNDANPYLALARWHFSLAELGWVTRKMAAALFAVPPEGSFVEAERLLKKAIACNPDIMGSYLWLAKTYLKKDNEAAARKVLEQGLTRRPTPYEAIHMPEIRKLLASL